MYIAEPPALPIDSPWKAHCRNLQLHVGDPTSYYGPRADQKEESKGRQQDLTRLCPATASKGQDTTRASGSPSKTPAQPEAAKAAQASSSKQEPAQNNVFRGSTKAVGQGVLQGEPVKPKGAYHPDGPIHLATPFDTMRAHVETTGELGPGNDRTPLISTSESAKQAGKFVNKNKERRKSGTFLTIDRGALDPPPTTDVNKAYEDRRMKNKYANQQEISVDGSIPSKTVKKVDFISQGTRTSIDNPNYKSASPPSGGN
ncbi:hypothetical protein PpBr36_02411 [Pyricularia pennisetigena]|uniref:hypothetical protein n=1 Tax=Pyricularia pennisetigena TaxID=1578925 RepID=UPI001154A963|nr:hypothetical protein PpBr36_02411 [Pyricularia pennisetigena]TLS31178.1 hypothetical protein PpBr36_02411 [Pyricularia pennisetigena]